MHLRATVSLTSAPRTRSLPAMRWFFATFATVTAVLFLSFVAWIATRVMHLDTANYVVGRIMIYDLYAIAVVMGYSAFVGGFHLWEKLTGRMEAEQLGDEKHEPQ